MSRIARRGLLSGATAGGLLLPFIRPGRAAPAIQMISHRFPAIEYIAGKVRTAIPGVEVNAQLMPFDKALELATIAFSSKATTPDIVYANDSTFLTFAKAGKEPPKTLTEYRALAKSFNSPSRAGTISCLRPVDAALNETSWYMNALGDGWFDDKWRPVFNDTKGVAAIEMLKEITRYAQPGFTSAANDECMIALQEDAAVMGVQWGTRALAMDDPDKSRVVGKMEWAVPPQGHQPFGTDGYCISAFSKQDPDLLFRLLAIATSKQNLRGAAGLMVPTRTSLLEDPELKQKYRFFPAELSATAVGTPLPKLPEFYSVGQFITQRVNQAVTGQMSVKAAMDAAAGETKTFLEGHGYYQ